MYRTAISNIAALDRRRLLAAAAGSLAGGAMSKIGSASDLRKAFAEAVVEVAQI